MTIDTAIRLRLVSLSPVVALLGGSTPPNPRIYTVILPQDLATWPAVLVKLVDDGQGLHFRGPNGLIRSRVSVETFGKSKASVDQVDALVDGDGKGTSASGLKGFTGAIAGTSPAFVVKVIEPAGKRDDFEAEEFKVFRAIRDFWVEYIP